MFPSFFSYVTSEFQPRRLVLMLYNNWSFIPRRKYEKLRLEVAISPLICSVANAQTNEYILFGRETFSYVQTLYESYDDYL